MYYLKKFRDCPASADILKRPSHFEIAGPFHDPENVQGQSRDCPRS